MTIPSVIAFVRVLERRARTSPALMRRGRRLVAMLAKRSREARAFVRLRLTPLV